MIGFILCKLVLCQAEAGQQGRGQEAISVVWVRVIYVV